MTDRPGAEPASARIPPERAITAGADVTHTGSMLGAQYAGLLVAAQGGDEGAFATLWRDANPALSRYLRVVTAGIAGVDAGDIARESWRTAIHRLADFEGDETAWRSLLFTAAHARVEVARIGRSWGDLLPGEGLALDELSGSDDTPVDQLAAPDAAPGDSGGDGWLAPVLTLPRGEAQVLMLAVAGELPDAEIARVVGSSVSSVRDLQEAALAHLGRDRETVAQALGAPGTPAELADEELAVAALRATAAVDHLAAALATRAAARGQEHRPKAAAPKHVIVLRSAASRAAAAVVATALVGFGAVSEAAYSGALPEGFQDVMHEVIGAPTPTERLAGKGHTAAHAQRPTTTGTSAATSSGRTSTLSGTTSTVSPVGTTPAVPVLCRGWATDQQDGVAAADSAAYRALAAAAGGGSGVAALCEQVTATTSPTVTATTTPTTQPTSPEPTPVPSTTTTIPTEPTTTPTDTTTPTPDTTTTTPDTTTTTPAVPETTTTTVPDITTTTVPDSTTTTPTPETTTTTTPDPETTTTPAPETTTKHEPETTTSAPATTTPAAETSTTQAPETTTQPVSQTTTTTPTPDTTTTAPDQTSTAPGKTPPPEKTTPPPATTPAPASSTPAPRNAKRHREGKSERTKARRHKHEHSKGGKHRRR